MDRDLAETRYAGSLFAHKQCAVLGSVRTREAAFVEVGDRMSLEPVRDRREQRQPEVFLRARLAGEAMGDGSHIPAELDERIRHFAGPYWVEVWRDEVTLLGQRPLDPGSPDRVREAFALAEALAQWADSTFLGAQPPVALAPIGQPPADGPDSSRPGHPGVAARQALTTVLATLGLLVGGSLAFAIVMSFLGDHLRGDRAMSRLVVGILIALTMVAVSLFLRWVLSRRERDDTR
ncbi:MAG: hypothetical protein LWW86_15455 [Micrococcales bacterium]|nr:hypothetical protein [Micrococcales bacterium]